MDCNYVANLVVLSRYNDEPITVEANVVAYIPYSVQKDYIDRICKMFSSKKLAEYALDTNGVDIMIGGQHFHRIMHDKREFVKELCVQDSQFGCVVAGPENGKIPAKIGCCMLNVFDVTDQLERF